MSMINFRMRTKLGYEPPSYTADSTDEIINVNGGDLLNGICVVNVTEVFDGSGTLAVLIVGDGGNDNGLLESGQMDESTLGLYRGGGDYFSTRPRLFTSDDTVDIKFSRSTGANGTTGRIDVMIEVGRVHPW